MMKMDQNLEPHRRTIKSFLLDFGLTFLTFEDRLGYCSCYPIDDMARTPDNRLIKLMANV